MRIEVTSVDSRSIGGGKAAWTIEIRRWSNIVDRPAGFDGPPDNEDLPEEVREALVNWAEGRNW